MEREEADFVARHPKSQQLAQEAKEGLLSGVPMPWMVRWPGAFPLFVDKAQGSSFVCADGHSYVDFCLGDTGAMTGHSVEALSTAVGRQLKRGLTTMLPTADAQWVANNLSERFGLPKWQFAMTATDANRFVLRFARHLTKRPKIVVHDWCYHGTVDETLVVLDADGRTVSRPGAIGPQVDPGLTTVAVPFNDLYAMEEALASGDIACVLMEPALTNIGIVLPEPGYLEGMRELATKYGALLMIDETHTISAGYGGMTLRDKLDPDIFIIGKSIGAGIPSGAYGFKQEVVDLINSHTEADLLDVGGIGGTLAGNALSLAAMRATLGEVLTEQAFEHMIALATRYTDQVNAALDEYGVPWSISQLGARAEYRFTYPAPKTGTEAMHAGDDELDEFMHLFMSNRGVLMTPFHNMALMCPTTTQQQVDRHGSLFAQAMAELAKA